MKTGKVKSTEDSLVDNNSTSVEEKVDDLQRKQKGAVLITLLPLLSLLAVVFLGMIKNISGVEIAKISILTLILTAASVFFIRIQEEDILIKKYAKSIITISYLASILFIMLPLKPDIFSFWMIGGLIVSMLIDSKLGLLIYFNLTFILSITLSSLRPEATIQFLIMGVMMSLLSGALKQKSTVVYASIILLSTNITLAFVINNFIYEANSNYNYISSFFSIFVVLVVAFLLSQLYERISMQEQSNNQPLMKEGETLRTLSVEEHIEADIILELPTEQIVEETQEVSIPYDRGARTSYELLIEESNILLVRMKEFSEVLYEHAKLIGDLSGRAASLIGADELLAKAGGLYHEIGKLKGKNYIEEGLKLAEEYAFPNELKAILKQHNIKYEKPTSVEAAIVMLTDNVVSTIDYIRKTGDNKFTLDKIIDNIFQLRMDKGTFDESGLSVKDFKLLKEFYQKEYKK